MNILFDASLVSANRMDGINRYSVAMLKRIELPGIRYIANRRVAEKFGLKNVVYVPDAMSHPTTKGNLLRLLWKTFVMPFVILRFGVPVYYTPTHEGQTFPIAPQVITIHDLLPFLFPATFNRLKFYFRIFFPIWVGFSNRIISVSMATRNDLHEWYPKARPSTVVYEGVEVDSRDGDKDVGTSMPSQVFAEVVSQKYILMVSEQRLYKNIANGIRGFATSKASEKHRLVLVGKPNKSNQVIFELPKQLGIENKVIFTGFVSDSDLGKLYKSASGFLFPSLYEGFGLPLLEAMTYGCICFASATSSLLEIGENAAVFFDPNDPLDIAEKLDKVLIESSEQERTEMRGKSIAQATRFSFDDAATQISEIIRAVSRRKDEA